jgi:hypothetical protein
LTRDVNAAAHGARDAHEPGKSAMGRGRKRGGRDGTRRPPRLSEEPFGGADDDPDALFRAAMAELDASGVPDKDAVRARERAPSPKLRERRDVVIDLHRMTLAAAKALVERQLSAALAAAGGAPVTATIITGKGRHSPGEGVLAREVHAFVVARWRAQIVAIEDAPADLVAFELPIKGHFRVVLKPG